MSKDTTDELREQIQSCFKRNLMQTEGDTELFDTELTIDNLLALISNREKLARIDELEQMHTNINRNLGNYNAYKTRLSTLRKELDGGE